MAASAAAKGHSDAEPGSARSGRPRPDFALLHTERRKPGVTLELLHLEYIERHPDGYRSKPFSDL
jgi:hypothetical protein